MLSNLKCHFATCRSLEVSTRKGDRQEGSDERWQKGQKTLAFVLDLKRPVAFLAGVCADRWGRGQVRFRSGDPGRVRVARGRCARSSG